MTAVLDWVGTALIIAGALLALTAGIGLLRFPDVLSRMHATSKPQALGLILVLAGAVLRLRTVPDATTLGLVAAFQLLTVPVAAAMIGRAAYRAGEVDADSLAQDALADRLAGERGEDPDPDEDPDDGESVDQAPAQERPGPDEAAGGAAGPDGIPAHRGTGADGLPDGGAASDGGPAPDGGAASDGGRPW